jgi:hypothetical protein
LAPVEQQSVGEAIEDGPLIPELEEKYVIFVPITSNAALAIKKNPLIEAFALL